LYKKLQENSKLNLLLVLIVFSLPSLGQKTSKTFLSGAFQIDMPKNTTGLGGRIAGGANINQLLLFGVGVGITKLQAVDKAIIPLFAHFALGDFNKKIFPYLVAEPGYGFYDNSKTLGGDTKTTKGGFSFYGGVGMGVSTGKKSKITGTFGYSLYNFETKNIGYFGTDKVNSAFKGLAFKITLIGL
jgi:hypothetical protein